MTQQHLQVIIITSSHFGDSYQQFHSTIKTPTTLLTERKFSLPLLNENVRLEGHSEISWRPRRREYEPCVMIKTIFQLLRRLMTWQVPPLSSSTLFISVILPTITAHVFGSLCEFVCVHVWECGWVLSTCVWLCVPAGLYSVMVCVSGRVCVCVCVGDCERSLKSTSTATARKVNSCQPERGKS